MRGLRLLAVLLALGACGRYFPQPLQPTADQSAGMTVNDDGSITYDLERLSITLKPMTDAELNRLVSPSGDPSVNPYTFGDWTPLGQDWTPPRFTVFQIKVANYQYPKVRLDPLRASLTTTNNRHYAPLSYQQLYDYYYSYYLGRTGQGRLDFRDRTDMLRRTMYSGDMIFSGNDEEGFLVFPLLHDDVKEIQVHLDGIALRFNYAGEPVESLDLNFSFKRDVLRGITPAAATLTN